MKSTTKRDLKYQSGTVIPAGTALEVRFDSNRHSKVYFDWNGETKSLHLVSCGDALTGFSKCPSVKTLEKWNDNGTCKTPTGKIVEPDGYGDDGSPSWLLVMGLI